MQSCTLLLALAAVDATRRLGGGVPSIKYRGGSTLTSRKLFATEELEHPFSALAAFLCEAPELGEKGPKRVRRALLNLVLACFTDMEEEEEEGGGGEEDQAVRANGGDAVASTSSSPSSSWL